MGYHARYRDSPSHYWYIHGFVAVGGSTERLNRLHCFRARCGCFSGSIMGFGVISSLLSVDFYVAYGFSLFALCGLCSF